MGHPVFARFYQWSADQTDRAGGREHRLRQLQGLSGRGVEIGSAHGNNFGLYPHEVEAVVAVEPESFYLTRARQAATGGPVRLVSGRAEALPLAPSTMDFAVASLTFCSVTDPRVAAEELFRVLKPGGHLRFYEHGPASEGPLVPAQRVFGPLWTQLAGGCHLRRDLPALLAQVGFEVQDLEHFDFVPRITGLLTRPHTLGTARRPPNR